MQTVTSRSEGTYITRFWFVPGVSQTLHCCIRSASFPLFAPVERRPLVLVFTDTLTGGTLAAGGGTGGGGNVISVLVEVATNICGLDSDAASPSGRGIGLILRTERCDAILATRFCLQSYNNECVM